MSEQSTELKVFSVDYICDTCAEGTMQPSGVTIARDPHPLFPHACDKCGVTQIFEGVRYPLIRYVTPTSPPADSYIYRPQ